MLVIAAFPVLADDDATFASRDYKTLSRFGIPTELFTDHYYFPTSYITNYKVTDLKAKLSYSEKLSAALLIIAADRATTEKYGQSYGVSMRSPLMVLLANNFPEVKAIKPSHDIDEGELPIRDIGDFFRKWLRKATCTETKHAEQGAAGNPLPAE